MIRALTLLLAFCFSSQSLAKDSLVPVAKDLKIFVQHQAAKPGKTTIVVLNGLTHTTENWDKVFANLKLNGEGLLKIDLHGQGRTLANHGAVTDIIRYQQQSVYVARVLANLGIRSKVTLLGLSYGGGIATYFAAKNPQAVEKVILLAPYTEPQPEQDKWIRDQVQATRIAFPYNTATDDELYDYYLRQLVYNTYPVAEPELLTIPFKLEAVFRMAQGIRKLHVARFVSTLPAKSVFLVGGVDDQIVKTPTLDSFWKAVPEKAKASRLVIKGTDHNMITFQPKAVARWIQRILANDPQTLSGQTIEVNP